MLNFDVELARPARGARNAASTVVPTVVETVRVTPLPEPAPQAGESQVGWEQVRDYVMGKIEAAGPVPRNQRQENTIFMGFASRWKSLAMPIARHAFEQCEGMWMNAPVGVHRFHRTADPYFAQRIAEKLNRNN